MSPRLGIMARADARGVAWQTLEMVRHLNPDKVLCVLMNDLEWPEDLGRFAEWDTTFVDSNLSPKLHERTLDERKCRKFLAGLDVVMAVETVYDWEFVNWAHEAGVRVIVAGNPEFYAHHHHPDWPQPDVWAWPTPWMRDQLPDGVDLPVPCVERPQTVADPDERTLNVLHVIGKMAANDRNGSLDFIEALPSLRGPTKVRIAVQGDSLPRKVRCGSNVELEVITGSVENRWDLFADCHVLTMPRKYGGLCLDREHEVAMKDGQRRQMGEVRVGDEIRDAAGSTTVIGRTERRVQQHVEVSVRGRLLRSSVDHIHMVSPTSDPSGLREVRATDVQPGEWMFVRQPDPDGVRVVDVGPKPVVKALRFWPESTVLDEGWARLIGLWLAEGHRGRYPRTGRDRPESVVVWSFGERDSYLADEVQELLEERGVNSHAVWATPTGSGFGKPVNINGQVVQVKARSVWFNAFLDELGVGQGSFGKRAPDVPVELVPHLVGGWLDGDGNLDGRTIRGFSRSTAMIADLWRLSLKAGVLGGISHHGQALNFTGSSVDTVGQWGTRFPVPDRLSEQPDFSHREVDGGWMVRVSSVTSVDEPLDVVAIETSTGTYVAEDVLTHNCLPALEAMATGMCVMMTDTSPNEIWPGPRVPARKGRIQRSPFGKIQCWATHPIDIASKLNRLNSDRDALRVELEEAARFAELQSWENLRPRLYEPVLRGEMP